MRHGFTYDTSYMLTPGTTIAWAELPSCVTPSLAYYHLRPTTPTHLRSEEHKQAWRS
jgi:hypothetical protein